MPVIDFLQEWQRAEAACVSAYQAMYAKVRGGVVVSAGEKAGLACRLEQAPELRERVIESGRPLIAGGYSPESRPHRLPRRGYAE